MKRAWMLVEVSSCMKQSPSQGTEEPASDGDRGDGRTAFQGEAVLGPDPE